MLARLRVDIERQDAARSAQLSRPNMAVTDYPGDETATQRDAATTVEQNSAWVKVRRDAELENELLAQLLAQFDVAPARAVE